MIISNEINNIPANTIYLLHVAGKYVTQSYKYNDLRREIRRIDSHLEHGDIYRYAITDPRNTLIERGWIRG